MQYQRISDTLLQTLLLFMWRQTERPSQDNVFFLSGKLHGWCQRRVQIVKKMINKIRKVVANVATAVAVGNTSTPQRTSPCKTRTFVPHVTGKPNLQDSNMAVSRGGRIGATVFSVPGTIDEVSQFHLDSSEAHRQQRVNSKA